MTRRLTLCVPSVTALERLAAEARPGGASAGPPEVRLLRDTYFDTSDGALRERRMTLRLRLDASGRRLLRLVVVTSINLEGVFEEMRLEEGLPANRGLYEALSLGSELAVRIRDLVDPTALRPLVALDIDREIRHLRTGWLGRAVHRLSCDRILAYRDDETQAFQQVTLTQLGSGRPRLEALGERLVRDYGLTADGLDTLERARRRLADAGAGGGASGPNVRGALLLVLGDAVALEDGPTGLVLPTGPTGEEPMRRLAAGISGHAEPELDFVGFAQGRGSGPDLEVWMARAPGSAPPAGTLFHLPLIELLERVGAPRLRDPGLVAALLLLVRSDAGRRWLRDAPPPAGAPTLVPTARTDPPEECAREEDLLEAELSILDFNQRVLELAEDPDTPLLERFRFLSIFASNMDEYFVMRVGKLKGRARGGTAAERAETELLLDAVSIRARALMARQHRCLQERLAPAFARGGVRLLRWGDLGPEAHARLTERFAREILPLLTPQALSAAPGHPPPHLPNLRLSLAAVLRETGAQRPHLAHVPIPRDLPRFLAVDGGPDLILIDDVIAANAATLFPGYEVESLHALRMSRRGDVEIDEETTGSFLTTVADGVEARPYNPVVRIEIDADAPGELRTQVLRQLRSERGPEGLLPGPGDVFELEGLPDLRSLSELCALDPALGTYPPFQPGRSLDPTRSVFAQLRESDILVHHPFDAFDGTVERFLAEAARDPDVVSIKMTLYRTGRDSPVVEILLEALRNGKEVSVFVELKARLDEESNIRWTHRLAEAGAHVVYGVVGYKLHAKAALVVRRERGGLARYTHVGSGNYDAATARLYTDLGLLSADPDIGADLGDFFNELTGSPNAPKQRYRRLWVAPASLAPNLLGCIEREIEHARAGRPALIRAKMNGITDRKIVRALYRASGAGVRIELVVRAVCTLRPGVPRLSENISVRSILGRFLEHARIYHFLNGGEEEYYIGSADWRRRNLRRRVEILVPVLGAEPRGRLRSILDTELTSSHAWILRPDGAYERLRGQGPHSQDVFLDPGTDA